MEETRHGRLKATKKPKTRLKTRRRVMVTFGPTRWPVSHPPLPTAMQYALRVFFKSLNIQIHACMCPALSRWRPGVMLSHPAVACETSLFSNTGKKGGWRVVRKGIVHLKDGSRLESRGQPAVTPSSKLVTSSVHLSQRPAGTSSSWLLPVSRLQIYVISLSLLNGRSARGLFSARHIRLEPWPRQRET
jgi:hypothetical protein